MPAKLKNVFCYFGNLFSFLHLIVNVLEQVPENITVCFMYMGYAMQIGHLVPLRSVVGKLNGELRADGWGQCNHQRTSPIIVLPSCAVCPSFVPLRFSFVWREAVLVPVSLIVIHLPGCKHTHSTEKNIVLCGSSISHL